MAETKKTTKPKQTKSNLVGNQAIAVPLGDATKLDIDTNKIFIDNIINASLTGGLDIAAIENFTSISNSRDQIYTVIDTMAKDSAVSAIIKTYADCACEMADNGHIVWCESTDSKISKFVNFLLNVINVDKNVYAWAYCLVKYGDVYLKLFRESDYDDVLFKKDNIDKAYSARNVLNEDIKKELEESVKLNVHKTKDPYSYYVEMIPDPGTMFELTKFGKTYGYIETPNSESALTIANNGVTDAGLLYANYKMKSSDINVYQADDFVHACLDDNFSRFPERVEIFRNNKDLKNNTNSTAYTVRRGKSMLIDNYKVWREKSLLEDAILLNRVTKSSIIRKVAVEVGDMPKEQVALTLRKVKDLFEQKTAINKDTSMSEYPNPGPIENNVYFATHNGQGAITVEAVGGDVDVKGLADLDSWVNKFYAGFGVPKAYYGWTDDAGGFNGGTSLSIISSQFAKGVKHVQNEIIQMITDLINLILTNKGFKSYLNNFVIKMKAPLTQEELNYREDLSNRITAISNMQSLFGDIEDKARKLTILKSLVGTLNYGDEIIEEIDAEILATKEAKKEEKKKAAEEAALESKENSETADLDLNLEATEEPAAKEEEEPAELDLDLGNSSAAPMEGFKPAEGTSSLVEDHIIEDADNLPSPEEISETIDFTENK